MNQQATTNMQQPNRADSYTIYDNRTWILPYSCRIRSIDLRSTLTSRGGHPVVTGTLDTLTKKLDLPLRHTRWPWLPLRACRLLRRFEPADEAGCAALACYPRQHTRGRVFRAARPRRQRFCSISSAPNVDGEGQQVRSCP